MATDDLLSAFAIHIHSAGSYHYTAISTDDYLELFHFIDKSIASRLTFQKPKDLNLSPDIVSIMSLAKSLKKVIANKKKVKCHVLQIEMLDKDADNHRYDDLCEGVCLALSDNDITYPWCITIAISAPNIFMESVLLGKRLIPSCKNKNIGLILLSDDKTFKPIVLCQGNLPSLREMPALSPSIAGKRQEETTKRLSTEEIEADFQVLFGHFEVEIVDGAAFHLPAIASVKKLARNSTFTKQIKDDASHILSSSNFNIFTHGIPGGGINELALAVAEGDTKKICNPNMVRAYDGGPILILCDFLCQLYPIEATIRDIRVKNKNHIAVIGIAQYKNIPELNGVEYLSYIETNYLTSPSSDLANCSFCIQNEPYIQGDHFEFFAREVKQFDKLTFWEFIKQNTKFYKVGHWISNRTPNHYLFTIEADPIFKRHSYGLAFRMRNIIESNKINSSWIKKIVCTADPELSSLSIAVSEVLGLQQKDVIRIPRKFITSISGKQIVPELKDYIKDEYGKDILRNRNVLILDQAAHHFKTMSSLRAICEYYDCTVLAFSVFLDRTDTALTLGEYLHDSNYFTLYSWPVPPRRAYECPCLKESS